jgi:polyprenyl P-hydroxybenzoate/phenylacrylic acid decarboxylase-like protein
MEETKRIVVAITGASGSIYGIRLLEVLRDHGDVETHLVVSPAGRRTLVHETAYSVADVESLADVVYGHRDIGAPLASGTFVTHGMVVCPCSVRTLSALALSASDNLITRAGDVCLKEGRPLVAVLRETPLHLGHLRLAAQLTEIGGVVMPPVPAFYPRPETVADIVDQTVGRVLQRLGVPVEGLVEEWQGDVVRDEP